MKIDKKILELISLEGKVAMITGGVSGIGLATAKRLSEVGANIALLDIDESKSEKAIEEIRISAKKVKFYKGDVTSYLDCKKVAEDVYKEFGRIDILFNNAGVIRRKNIIELV